MDSTTITLVRHGETEWNVSMRLQGFRDSPLTGNGLQQVKLLAAALKEKNFDLIYSSDQGRAMATANEINRYHQIEIKVEPMLRERNFGVMEGYTREQILELYPEVHAGYMERKSAFQIPEGESLVQFFERINGILNSIAERNQGKNVLLVSHGGVLDCTMRKIFSMSLDERRNFEIQNTAINTFAVQHNFWKLVEWGNTNHLAGLKVLDEYATG